MPDDDLQHEGLTRFLLSRSGVRGALVRLSASWQQIRQRGNYPAELAVLLGETAAAACLLTSHIKVDGRLAIQLRAEGPLRTLFADCSHEGQVRGLALWQPPLPQPLSLRELGRHGVLAITIERAPQPGTALQRYQGLVDLAADDLSRAFEGYFQQSEQLPTRLLLAADRQHACGLLLQQLPGESCDSDGWPRSQALFDTLAGGELLATEPGLLLHRMFHEEALELLSHQPLRFGCSCSRRRVGDVLLAIGRDEAEGALDPQLGVVEVTCEFCGERFRFDPVDLDQLFAGGGSEPPAGGRAN